MGSLFEHFFLECPYCHTKSKESFGPCGSFHHCPKCGKHFLYNRNKGIRRAKLADWLLTFGFLIIVFGPVGIFFNAIEGAGNIRRAILIIIGISIVIGVYYLFGEKGRKLISEALDIFAENLYRTFVCIPGTPCKSEDEQKDGQKTDESGPAGNC